MGTWPPDMLQYVWTFAEADFDTLAGRLPNAVRMDAGVLMGPEEVEAYRKMKLPIPLLKDIVQFRCLAAYGGWWADLDICWLRPGVWKSPQEWAEANASPVVKARGSKGRLVSPGNATGADADALARSRDLEVLFFTEEERQEGAWAKGTQKLFTLGGRLVSLNLGLMWARAESPLLAEIDREFTDLWRRGSKVWQRAPRTTVRQETRWSEHQLRVMDRLVGRSRIRLAPPSAAFCLPRWLTSVPWHGAVLYGVRIPAADIALASAVALCTWTGGWKLQFISDLLLVAREAVPNFVCNPWDDASLARRPGELGRCGIAHGTKSVARAARNPELDSSEVGHGESCAAASSEVTHGASCAAEAQGPPPERGAAERPGVESAEMVAVMALLHRQGLQLLSRVGVDLVLAHQALASAIGFVAACGQEPLRLLPQSTTAVAYGFLCLAQKFHWPWNYADSGLLAPGAVWSIWARELQLPSAEAAAARRLCELAFANGGVARETPVDMPGQSAPGEAQAPLAL